MKLSTALASIALSGCATTGMVDKGLEPALTTAQALDSALEPRRRAVLIGVDDYEDPVFTELRFAGADARALGEVLSEDGGGGFEQVIVLDEPHETTRAEILRVLLEAREELRREDLLVVYFSGHGTRAWDGERWRRYLLTGDSRASDLEGTAIDLENLQDFLPQLAPERKALIVDACFHGDGKSAVRPTDHEHAAEAAVSFVSRPTAMAAGEARLFATTPGRPAREDDRLEHGVYTYYLLDALSWAFDEADLDEDGVVTAWEAHDYARGRTMEHTEQVQVPEASFRVVGQADLVLTGDRARRIARDRALVYLYTDPSDALHGARILVDGRDRGVLPGTIPVQAGRRHLTVLDAQGERLAEGHVNLARGQSLRVDDLTRLVRGPRNTIALREQYFYSPDFAVPMGGFAGGLSLAWMHRVAEGPRQGVLGGVELMAALTPSRQDLDGNPRMAERWFYQVGVMGGYQDDWRRLRLRASWWLDAVWIPPSWIDEPPEGPVDPAQVPMEAGWLFAATGPELSLGVVPFSILALTASWRPHVAWLDLEGDDFAEPLLWHSWTIGIELAR
jgi:uncharacterized caspase-like protein